MMMTWQPIESAPRNGDHILVSDGTLIFLAYSYTKADVWRDSWNGSGMTNDHDFTPTHWMPLPEPPKREW